MQPAHILVGAAADYEYLQDRAATGTTGWWSSLKNAQPGDIAYFYVERPYSGIVAVGRIKCPMRGNRRWPYRSYIHRVRLLAEPITIRRLKSVFPHWKWLTYPRHACYAPENIARRLATLARASTQRQHQVESQIKRAAGFGKPEENRKVELAACRFVRHYFEHRGYRFISREKESLGYDFDAIRGSSTLHVEVKGISGTWQKFPITAGEVHCARSDRTFHIAIVTEARTAPRLTLLTGKEFLRTYRRTPIAYFAEPIA